MKTDKIKVKEGREGDKSLIWTVSDAYVNWCQIVVGNPSYLEKLYSTDMSKDDAQNCLECLNHLDKFPSKDGEKITLKGPCGEDELNHWRKLNELIELRKRCSELQRRLETETIHKFKMAITPDCRKRALDCPCYPNNKDQYVKNLPKVKTKKEIEAKKKEEEAIIQSKKMKQSNNAILKKRAGMDTGKTGKDQCGLEDEESSDSGCKEFVLSNIKRKIPDNKIYTFKTNNACFEGNVFKERICGERLFYPNGKVGARLECDGTGKLFYPNGEVAATVTKGRLGTSFLC